MKEKIFIRLGDLLISFDNAWLGIAARYNDHEQIMIYWFIRPLGAKPESYYGYDYLIDDWTLAREQQIY